MSDAPKVTDAIKPNLSCFGKHPDLESSFYEEKWVLN